MLINNDEYFDVLNDIKTRIKTAQYKAVLGVNYEQILLYWNIGKIIIANTKYGTKFVENLANDIKAEFPNIKGFSARNLKYMRKFAEIIDDKEKVQTLSALLSWSHNTLPSAEDIEKRVKLEFDVEQWHEYIEIRQPLAGEMPKIISIFPINICPAKFYE